MSVSLFQLSVQSYLQSLGAVNGFLAKGAEHFTEHQIDTTEVLETRIFEDMLPLTFQLNSVAHHSLGAVNGLLNGQFSPPPPTPELDYAGWQELIAGAYDEVAKFSADQVDQAAGSKVIFKAGDFVLPFTAEDFVISFSLPNFHFHVTTAYDILRLKGVPLGKRDYLGQMKLDKS